MSTTSPGEVAARLVVEFCLPMIQGAVQARAPVLGRQLTALERDGLGVTGDGVTMVFEARQSQVYVDLANSQALVWFNRGDCESAAGTFDAILRAAYPATQMLEEVAHPSGRAMRVRGYDTPLGGDKLARLEVGYPNAGAPNDDLAFVVRVNALQRTAATTPAAPPTATPPPVSAAPAAAAPAAPPPAPTASPEPPNDEPPKKKKGWF